MHFAALHILPLDQQPMGCLLAPFVTSRAECKNSVMPCLSDCYLPCLSACRDKQGMTKPIQTVTAMAGIDAQAAGPVANPDTGVRHLLEASALLPVTPSQTVMNTRRMPLLKQTDLCFLGDWHYLS